MSHELGAAVTKWARDNIALHDGLSITLGKYGLQVETISPIRAGEILLSVPGDLLVTSTFARKASERLGFSAAGGELVHEEAHVEMALWLMNATASPEAAPRHSGWLEALPAAFDCTIEWSENELSELQASAARNRARSLRRWADAEHRRLLWHTDERASSAPWSQTRFRWALCAVWSRSFHLQHGTWRVLPPAADFFNHAVTPSVPAAHLEVMTDEDMSADETHSQPAKPTEHASPGGAIVRFVAIRDLEVGSSVEIDYGARANAEMLTTHGFAVPNNPYESSARKSAEHVAPCVRTACPVVPQIWFHAHAQACLNTHMDTSEVTYSRAHASPAFTPFTALVRRLACNI